MSILKIQAGGLYSPQKAVKQLHADGISGTNSATGAQTTLVFPVHKQRNLVFSTHRPPAPRSRQDHREAAWPESCVSHCFVGSKQRAGFLIFPPLALDLPRVQTESESCSSSVARTAPSPALCLHAISSSLHCISSSPP